MQTPLQINTSVHIYDLVNVDISNAQFTVVFGIKVEWFDKRLEFGFLKEDALRNNIEYYLTGEKKIWTPEIDFVMQADNDERCMYKYSKCTTNNAILDWLTRRYSYQRWGRHIPLRLVISFMRFTMEKKTLYKLRKSTKPILCADFAVFPMIFPLDPRFVTSEDSLKDPTVSTQK